MSCVIDRFSACLCVQLMPKHATLSADASGSGPHVRILALSNSMSVDWSASLFMCFPSTSCLHHRAIISGLFFCVFCRKHIASTLKSQQQNWVSKGEGEKKFFDCSKHVRWIFLCLINGMRGSKMECAQFIRRVKRALPSRRLRLIDFRFGRRQTGA
jgi:hypothetical protein